jgi:hypothetical protein
VVDGEECLAETICYGDSWQCPKCDTSWNIDGSHGEQYDPPGQ